MSTDFILVYFLGDEPLGKTWERRRAEWPLHITLVPWFGSAQANELTVALERCAGQIAPFRVELAEIEQFNEKTTVSLLKDQTQMCQLHEALLETIQALSVQLTSTKWVKDAYKAHVTHHAGTQAPELGEKLSVNTFSLVALQPMNQCKVIKHFALGAGHETAA